MGAIALPSPAGWKIFRSQTDSASNSTSAAPTPPITEKQPPLVSQLVCTGGEEISSSGEESQGQAKPNLTLGEQTKPASSAPATLRPTPKTKAATRPRSFIATSKVKTFGKPLAPGPAQQQQLPPANTSRPTEQTGLLRSLAAKKRLPRWLSRSSDAIEVSKPQLVSSTSSHASVTALEPILLLRRAETAPGLPTSLIKEVSTPIPCVTFEQDGETTGRKRSASMSTAQLLEEAATKLMKERSTATGHGKALPTINDRDAKAQGKTSGDIISRDAKLQNGLREVLNGKSNKSTPSLPSAATATAAVAAKGRPSDTPPHSISRKAVPKLPSHDYEESDFLPQELPLKSEMLYPGISSSVHLSTDAPTLHNIVVARASDEFERLGDDADGLPAKAHSGTREGMSHAHDDSVSNALKDKVIDLTKEVEAWKKSKLAQRASRQEQEQQKKVRRVRVQDVDMGEKSLKSVEKTQEQTDVPCKEGSAEGPCNAPPAQPATPSKHRISRSSNGSQRSRPPSVPLPSLPTTPRKPQQQRAPPQRKVSEAATQTSELAFVVTHREQRNGTTPQCSPLEVDTAAPLIDLDTPCAADKQTVPAPCPAPVPAIAPGHSPADDTLTFVSQEEASLDFGSLGPPTDSSSLPSSNAARLSTKRAAGVNGGGGRKGKLANAKLPILNGGRNVHVPQSAERYISSTALSSLRRPADQQALETQFWSLLAQVQAREFGYADALGHELAGETAAGGEAETSSTSTLSFAGIRDWRERVASEAGRLRKTQHGPATEVFLAAAAAREDREAPHMLRVVSHSGGLPPAAEAGQWDDLGLPSAVFPPRSTLATRGSASHMTEANVQMQLAQNGNEEGMTHAPVKPIILPTQMQAHVSTASSSMLSWGTRSRRTLSEHEAQRLFGSLAAVPKAAEEWGVKSGLADGLEEQLAQDPAGERGRKRLSRDTFGVASFDQRQKAGQLAETNAPKEVGLAAHNTLTTTTTTTTATQSVISVTRSTSGPSPQAPPTVPPLDTALAHAQTVSHSMCESTSTPTAQHPSTTLDLTNDEQLQRALELVAHRIGIASEELERLKGDLHLIARAKGEKDGGEGAAVNGGKGAVLIEA